MNGMPDREKVIKGLECCQHSSKSHCNGCPYFYDGLCSTNDCTADLASDAIALLKEQEAKTVLHREERSVIPVKALSGFCPKCSHTLIYGMNKHFCGNCGQEVKWE